MNTALKVLEVFLKVFVVVLGFAFIVVWLMFKVAMSAMAPAGQGQRIQSYYRY
ncbi:hypothetical protein [Streptosporangium sp. CA-115845]|uniref:hypothetical protein n=1 Tax=Streptosporangium sp. CA-115845 TaxID=3240071 RepID=UPI003D8DA7DC